MRYLPWLGKINDKVVVKRWSKCEMQERFRQLLVGDLNMLQEAHMRDANALSSIWSTWMRTLRRPHGRDGPEYSSLNAARSIL